MRPDLWTFNAARTRRRNCYGSGKKKKANKKQRNQRGIVSFSVSRTPTSALSARGVNPFNNLPADSRGRFSRLEKVSMSLDLIPQLKKSRAADRIKSHDEIINKNDGQKKNQLPPSIT